MDGASTDGTLDYLTNIPPPRQDGSALLWASAPDQGIYDAMNKGINHATGSYLLFLNAGDRLASPDALARIKLALNKQSFTFLYGPALEERAGQTPALKPARSHTAITRGMVTHHQAMLYRRDIVGDMRYDLSYRIAADYDFTLRFLRRAHENVLILPFPVCLFEAGGVSQRRPIEGRQEQFKIREKLNYNKILNALIYTIQYVSYLIKTRAPRIYWALRSIR